MLFFGYQCKREYFNFNDDARVRMSNFLKKNNLVLFMRNKQKSYVHFNNQFDELNTTKCAMEREPTHRLLHSMVFPAHKMKKKKT